MLDLESEWLESEDGRYEVIRVVYNDLGLSLLIVIKVWTLRAELLCILPLGLLPWPTPSS